MRIGIDATKILPPRDGIGNYTSELIGAMMRQESPHRFLLYGLVGPDDPARFAESFPDCPDHFEIRRVYDPDPSEADLYHSLAHGFPPPWTGRSVFTCHDLTILTHAPFHTVENKVNCMLGMLRAHLRDTHFIAISQATTNALQEVLGVPEDRISKVLSGRAEHFTRLEPAEIDRRLARFGLDRPFVLSVGTQEPRKNLLRLLKAYAALPETVRQQYPLVICGGSGWKHDATEAFFKRPELADVRRLGRVSDDELVALYNAAAVFTFPSLAEGFGLPIVEALACGTAVLTSNISSMPEIAGDAACLVDPHDVRSIQQGLLTLLTDDAERQRLESLSTAQAARFSWRRTAAQTLAVYDRVFESAS